MVEPLLHIPAVRVTQPVGEFFLCSLPARVLLEVAYSIPATARRENGVLSSILGTQRRQSDKRAKEIGAYIDESDSTFPNTIILSANYDVDGNYAEDADVRWRVAQNGGNLFYLTIPTNKRLASIIDGQHRIQGFRYAENKDRLNVELPCAVFVNLPRPYQAKIFATININQKRVDKSLAYELFGYDLAESDSGKWPPDMLGVYLARALEGTKGSPFQNHVKLALLEEATTESAGGRNAQSTGVGTDGWQISVACLVEGVTRLISERPSVDRSLLASGKVRDRSELSSDKAPLRDLYIAGKDKSLLDIVTAYFEIVEKYLWEGSSAGSFIKRTVGVLALFDLFREALLIGEADASDVASSMTPLIVKAEGIDFSDDFFQASGAGRVRIRNVLRSITGLADLSGDKAVMEAIKRLT